MYIFKNHKLEYAQLYFMAEKFPFTVYFLFIIGNFDSNLSRSLKSLNQQTLVIKSSFEAWAPSTEDQQSK